MDKPSRILTGSPRLVHGVSAQNDDGPARPVSLCFPDVAAELPDWPRERREMPQRLRAQAARRAEQLLRDPIYQPDRA
jgi:hypothetical protein